MKYEELIAQLCEVIKESENNAQLIYDNAEIINQVISDLDIPLYKKEKIRSLLSEIYGLLQNQDLHRQKIERVMNLIIEKHNICKETLLKENIKHIHIRNIQAKSLLKIKVI